MSSILDPPIPRLANTDGEDLIKTFVRFEVSDSAGLAAALDGATDLDRNPDGKTAWLWTGKNQEGKIVHLGRLVLEGKSLALECNSVRRGERGRAMIEVVAGDTVRHRTTTHENIEKKVRDAIRLHGSDGAPEPSPDELPRAVQEALVLDALARHYRKWIDDQIPALDDHTPRQAAADASLRPKLADLIRGLEGFYQQALMDGKPAYDPSWMWSELGIEDRTRLAYPPALAHERMASMVTGLGGLCRRVAENLRRKPGFDDPSTIVSADDIRTNLDIQRFLRENRLPETPSKGPDTPGLDNLSMYLEVMINFELHRRKTFWVDESLAYMLAKTDLDVPGSDLQAPFTCFAFVFTDRYVLSLAPVPTAGANPPVAGPFFIASWFADTGGERLKNGKTSGCGGSHRSGRGRTSQRLLSEPTS